MFSSGGKHGLLLTLQALLEKDDEVLIVAHEKNLIVISDEVYSGLTYYNHEFVSVVEFSEYQNNCVIIQSASKHFAMTGWRVDFVLGQPFGVEGYIRASFGGKREEIEGGIEKLAEYFR